MLYHRQWFYVNQYTVLIFLAGFNVNLLCNDRSHHWTGDSCDIDCPICKGISDQFQYPLSSSLSASIMTKSHHHYNHHAKKSLRAINALVWMEMYGRHQNKVPIVFVCYTHHLNNRLNKSTLKTEH